MNAGMSARAVSVQLHVNHGTVSRLKQRFREFGSTANRPHARRPRVTTPTQDGHIRLLHLRDRLRPATHTADETVCLHNRRISVQTVRNPLRASNIRARRPHQGLDLSAIMTSRSRRITPDLMSPESAGSTWKSKISNVLQWPAYSPDMSPIEHIWDVLDQRVRQRVPIPANVLQSRVTFTKEWNNIPQATTDHLLN